MLVVFLFGPDSYFHVSGKGFILSYDVFPVPGSSSKIQIPVKLKINVNSCITTLVNILLHPILFHLIFKSPRFISSLGLVTFHFSLFIIICIILLCIFFCEWTVENCLYKLIVNLLSIVHWLNLLQQNN